MLFENRFLRSTTFSYLRYQLPPAKQKSHASITLKAEDTPSQISCITGYSPAHKSEEQDSNVSGRLSEEIIGIFDFNNDFCDHSIEESRDYSVNGKLTSVDCWDETLDSPNNACIVRTNGDWLTRLATAVYGLQKLRPVAIAPKHDVCWAYVQRLHLYSKATMIVIC
ncbi:hypothetical protein N431DRAFT_471628 [Stipitochalara longipes BDJ]|nr:hypothetical protein N431DRAFT_471628 [Stipitochalara longipes BDJ]